MKLVYIHPQMDIVMFTTDDTVMNLVASGVGGPSVTPPVVTPPTPPIITPPTTGDSNENENEGDSAADF